MENKLETIKSLTPEGVIKKAWIGQVHVDEEGYFSDCPSFCDDCFWSSHFDVRKTPRIAEVKKLCETFQVRSHNEKAYTYFSPTPAAIEFLIKNCPAEIEQARQQLITSETARQEAEAKAKAEADAKASKETTETTRHDTELKALLEKELGAGYVSTTSGNMKRGEKVAEFIPDKEYAYPRWTAYRWADGKGVVVFHEHNDDFWQDYLYTARDAADKEQQKQIEGSVAHPSDSLIMTIIHVQTEGKAGSDYSNCYGSGHYKAIAQDTKLSTQAIENFKNEMLRTELSDDEKKALYSFRDYWYNSYKNACDYIGITQQATDARNIRKVKVEALKVEEKKKEEEAKQNKLNEMQKKVTALNPNLHIVSLGYSDSVTVKIGNGKRTSKEEFNEAVNVCKNAGGKYNYKEKTWTIKVS